MHRRSQQRHNSVKPLAALLREGGPLIGTWNQIAAPEITDIIGAAGFDFAIIDCEHGPFGIAEAERQGRACLAAGVAPGIRVAANDRVEIGKALDAGLGAVVVPNVASAKAAADAVAATRFAPEGTRGACPCVRACDHHALDWPAYEAAQKDATAVVALVEGTAGYDAFDHILTVPGLTAIMMGPFDLAVSMGLKGDWRAPAVQDAVASMTKRAIAAECRVILPLFAPSIDECRADMAVWQERGVNAFIIGTDKIILATALRTWATLKPQ
ncbi:MAG: aldolase/citrate lyase family protein [Devosia sp.]